MSVIEINVRTGEKLTRSYTQKELNDIAAYQPTQQEYDKQELESLRLKAIRAEQEALIINGTTPEALAYKQKIPR